MRMKAREREDDPKNFRDFVYRERKEALFGIRGAISDADYIISNVGDEKTFKNDVRSLVKSICIRYPKRQRGSC